MQSNRYRMLCLVAVASVAFAACSGAATTPTGSAATTAPGATPTTEAPTVGPTAVTTITVAHAIPDLKVEYWTQLHNYLEKKLKAVGWGYLAVGSDGDAAKQITDVENMLQEQPSILFFQPIDEASAQPVVDAANKAGVPVVSLFGEKLTGLAATMVLQPEIEGAKSCSAIVTALGGKGKAAIIMGPAGDFANRRAKGCEDVLTAGGITVVAKQNGDWTRATALTIAENMLQANPDLNAIAGSNDDSALGALEAIKGKGIDPTKFPVVGIDGSSDALTAICNGTMVDTYTEKFTTEADIMVDLTTRIVVNKEKITEKVPFTGDLVNAANVVDMAKQLGYTLPAQCVQ